MNLYPPMGRKNMAVLNRFNGISTLDPYTISENLATKGVNLDAESYPAMRVREAVSQVGMNSPYPAFVGMAGITRSFVTGGRVRLTYGFSTANQKIYMYNYGAVPQWSETNPVTSPSGLTGFADIDFTVWNDCVYAVRIPEAGYSMSGNKFMYKLDGNAVTKITTPEHFHAIESYNERMYGAYGNTVYVSDVGVPSDFTTVNVTDEIVLGSFNSDMVTALKAGNGKLIIFRRHSMYELYGETPTQFRPIEVASDIGCVNHKSVTNMQGVNYFIDTKGVYAYTGGRPRKISDTVDRYFHEMNWTDAQYAKCALETDGHRLFVNLGDDVMLVWNSEYNVWFEWKNMNVWSMLWNDNKTTFLATDGKAYEFGNTNTAVNWEWVSKPINTGSLTQKWRINKLWLTVDTVTASTVNVYVSKTASGTDWVLVRTITGTAGDSVRIPVNPGTAANAKVIRIRLVGSGICTVHEITRESRIFPLV